MPPPATRVRATVTPGPVPDVGAVVHLDPVEITVDVPADHVVKLGCGCRRFRFARPGGGIVLALDGGCPAPHESVVEVIA